MRNKKKINPCRLPVSQADLQRAKHDVRVGAVDAALTIFFSVLLDKEGMTPKDLQRIYAEAEYLSDSINKGYVTLADLRHVLKTEANVVISLGGDVS